MRLIGSRERYPAIVHASAIRSSESRSGYMPDFRMRLPTFRLCRASRQPTYSTACTHSHTACTLQDEPHVPCFRSGCLANCPFMYAAPQGAAYSSHKHDQSRDPPAMRTFAATRLRLPDTFLVPHSYDSLYRAVQYTSSM